MKRWLKLSCHSSHQQYTSTTFGEPVLLGFHAKSEVCLEAVHRALWAILKRQHGTCKSIGLFGIMYLLEPCSVWHFIPAKYLLRELLKELQSTRHSEALPKLLPCESLELLSSTSFSAATGGLDEPLLQIQH